MTLEQLRIFVAVATREHMTQAAQDLHLTQSATSAAIAALEARHATRLFDRVGRRIILTEAGRLFLIEAKAVLARATAAEAILSDLGDMRLGSLSIAASQTIANYWLPRVLQIYRERFPGIAIKLTIGNTTTVSQDVISGTVDLGLIEGEVTGEDLVIDHISDDELVLVAAPGHPWPGIETDVATALKEVRWILREPGSGTRSIFEAALPQFGLNVSDLSVALELPSNEAVRTAVEAGAGVTVMSRLVVSQALEAGHLRALPLIFPRRRFYLLRHRERYLARAAREFQSIIGSPDQPTSLAAIRATRSP